MAKNSKNYLISGLERGFGQAFQAAEQEERNKDVLDRQIALQEYKDQLAAKEEKEQNDLIEPLIKGRISEPRLEETPPEIVLTNTGGFSVARPSTKPEPQERDITPEEKIARILQLSPSGRAKYKEVKELAGGIEGYRRMSELLGLEGEKTVDKASPADIDRANRTIAANQLFGVSPEKTFEQVSGILNPKILKTIEQPYSQVITYTNGRVEEKPTEGLNPAYKLKYQKTDIEEPLKRDKVGNIVKRVGLYEPYAKIWAEENKGVKMVVDTERVPVNKTETNGEIVFSSEIKARNTRYSKDVNELTAYINDKEITEEERNEAKNELGKIRSNWSEEIKNTAPRSLKNWYKKLYNSQSYIGNDKKKHVGANPDPDIFWYEFMKAYKKGMLGKKAGKSLEAGYNLFRSTYGFNPLTSYPTNLEIEDYEQLLKDKNRDEEDTNNVDIE